MNTVITNHVLTFSADKFYNKVSLIYSANSMGMFDLRRAGEVVDYEFVGIDVDIVAYFESNESLVKFQMKYL